MRLSAILIPLVSKRNVSEQALLELENGVQGRGDSRPNRTLLKKYKEDNQDSNDIGSYDLLDRKVRRKNIGRKCIPSSGLWRTKGGGGW